MLHRGKVAGRHIIMNFGLSGTLSIIIFQLDNKILRDSKMETYTLAQFPSPVQTVHVAVFHNLQNAAEIRKRLIAAATTQGEEGDRLRAEVDYGFLEGNLVRLFSMQTGSHNQDQKKKTLGSSIDMRQIVSSAHLLTAIQATILNSLTPTGEIKTRSHNLHSEILLSLSPNNNITDSIRRHGLSDSTKELIVVRIEESVSSGSLPERQAEVWKGIEGVVKGDLVSVKELDKGDKVDWSRVDKVSYFRLSSWREFNQLI